MSKKTRVVPKEPSRFFCTECGQEGFPLFRKVGSQREPGHLKKLYCLNCKRETNHAEIRPFGSYRLEDFQQEFELGRFKDGQKRPIAELTACTKTDCPYNIHGRCWNDNGSFICEHKPKEAYEWQVD